MSRFSASVRSGIESLIGHITGDSFPADGAVERTQILMGNKEQVVTCGGLTANDSNKDDYEPPTVSKPGNWTRPEHDLQLTGGEW